MTRTRRAITSLTGLTCSFSGAPRRAHCGSKRSWSLPVSQIGGVRAVWVETTKGCLSRSLFNECPRCATQIIWNEYIQACITYTDYTHIRIIIHNLYQLDCNSGWQKVFDVWREFALPLRYENKYDSGKWTCGIMWVDAFYPIRPSSPSVSSRDERLLANLYVLSTRVSLRQIWRSHLKLQAAKNEAVFLVECRMVPIELETYHFIWKQTWIYTCFKHTSIISIYPCTY